MLRVRFALYTLLLLATTALQGVLGPPAAGARVAETALGFGTKPAPKSQQPEVLILTYRQRMQAVLGANHTELDALFVALQALATQVDGLIVDLGLYPDLADPGDGLYAHWDQAAGPAEASDRANHVLFGCHPHPTDVPPMHPWCSSQKQGIHDVVLAHLTPTVTSLLIVGDDRIIPMARVLDETDLLAEVNYSQVAGTTLAQAFAAGFFLSDDPLSIVDAVHADDLDERLLVLAQIATGRLVESVGEIHAAVDGFLVSTPVQLDSVLVTGYDFLIDSGKHIRDLLESELCSATSCMGNTLNSDLVGNVWGSVPWDQQDLKTRLDLGFDVLNLNGHGTHFQLGVPGTSPGLHVQALYGGGPNPPLAGSVVYALGCHSGLSVPDDSGVSEPLDLPQTLLSQGVLAYVGNTGYGWGLREGVGYSERLLEVFTEELLAGGDVSIGTVVTQSKEYFFLQDLRTDAYSLKSLMQWTLYGFPFALVQTGLPAAPRPFDGAPPTLSEIFSVPSITLGNVDVTRELEEYECLECLLPPVTRQGLKLELLGPDHGYVKYDAHGEPILPWAPGCPTTPPGCYLRLNGQVSGNADLPSLPTLTYDSRLSGKMQHGVLWRGGFFKIDDDFAFLHGLPESSSLPYPGTTPLPEPIYIDPDSNQTSGGKSVKSLATGSGETGSIVVATALQATGNTGHPSAHVFHSVEVDVFYLDSTSPQDDWTGPDFDFVADRSRRVAACSTSSFENVVDWNVTMSDPQDVWRVFAVRTDYVLTGGGGSWESVELTRVSGSKDWTASETFPCGVSRVDYFVQAVDHLGNVSWKQAPHVRPSGTVRVPEAYSITF